MPVGQCAKESLQPAASRKRRAPRDEPEASKSARTGSDSRTADASALDLLASVAVMTRTKQALSKGPCEAASALLLSAADELRAGRSSHNKKVKLDVLSKYFHLPEKAVATELGICLTSLKKLCRCFLPPSPTIRQTHAHKLEHAHTQQARLISLGT